jgi:8-oxo-dGTP diphosphatase
VPSSDVIAAMRRDSGATARHFGERLPDELDTEQVELCVDVWVFDPSLEWTLLVEHPERGWVMPGGRLEAGEEPRSGARRELREETGVIASGELVPVASHFGIDDARHVCRWGLSYALVVSLDAELVGEPGRAVRWWSLGEQWPSVYPNDRERLHEYVGRSPCR